MNKWILFLATGLLLNNTACVQQVRKQEVIETPDKENYQIQIYQTAKETGERISM